MCYTVESSISALITGVIGSGALLLNGERSDMILGFFFMFAICIQIFDAIFWSTDTQVKKGNDRAIKVNKFFTKTATLFVHLQPIVLGLLIYCFSKNKSLPKISLVALLIYTIIAICYTSKIWPLLTTTTERPPAEPGLFWEWTYYDDNRIMYTSFIACILTLMLQNLAFPANVLGSFMALSTLLFSIEKFGGKSDAGRWWCNFGAYIPLTYQVVKMSMFKT
jgi:hypothetical protein